MTHASEETPAIGAGAFRITDDSGELLRDPGNGVLLVYHPSDFKKGENGALYAAARKARALQTADQTVRLYGPAGFPARRYEASLKNAGRWPYRVPCSVAGCPHWIHPANQNEQPTCREHFAASPELVEQAERMREALAERRSQSAE